MLNYKVEVYFENLLKPEVSYHYDCDNEDEAIEEALESMSIGKTIKISDVECEEFEED